MTPAQFRSLALAMPGSEEKSHFGQPDFRVKGKIFAGLDPDGTRGTLKLPPELQAMLLDSRADAFSPAAGYWGRQGWTHVRVDAVDVEAARELIGEAWRLVAPKRLVASLEGSRGAAAQPEPSARKAGARKAVVRKTRQRESSTAKAGTRKSSERKAATRAARAPGAHKKP